jgi:hypothetical protein
MIAIFESEKVGEVEEKCRDGGKGKRERGGGREGKRGQVRKEAGWR